MSAATEPRYRILFWTLLGALVLLTGVLMYNDRPLVEKGYPKSQELQRVSSAPCAECAVKQWQQGRFTGRVTTGILIDTFAYIPVYSTLLAVCCFWLALRLADEQLRRVARVFAWGGWIAGAFDLLENGGMLLELRGRYGAAPLTAASASLKWTIATIVEIFIVAVFLRRRSLFGEDGVERHHDGG